MAVEYVKELWSGRKGSDGIERKRTYARVFEVRTTDQNDGPTVAGGDGGLPRNGDRFPNDAFAFMVKIDPEQHADDGTLWTVTCSYDTELPRGQAKEAQGVDDQGKSKENSSPTDRPENPLDRPPTYKVTHEQSNEPLEFTSFGVAVVNSATEPFDPPLEDDVSRAVVTITRNYAAVDFDWLEMFVDSVNSVAWRGRAARTCRILALDYDSHNENGVSFWQVAFRVKIKRETWDRRVIDRGYYERTQVGTDVETGDPIYKKTRIDVPAGSGVYPNEPQLLDGNGARLAAGLPPVELRYRVKPEKTFATLGI